jgi:hypothetical protein
MARKRVNLRYRKERCALSDLLPYEVPLTFTNRHFYDFLRTHRIEFRDGKLSWKSVNRALDVIVRIMFSLNDDPLRLSTRTVFIGEKLQHFNVFDIYGNINRSSPPSKTTIPFGYKIDHKQTEFRELTVPHPRNQIEMISFYDQCKETILYFCSLSPYSIRRPSSIAQYTYHKDETHYDNLANDEGIIEQQDQEYEHLRSFFVYKHYSNIYKFYESYWYHRCEKKYNALLKLDISKCFDSIYSHSIAWAVLGKDVVKEHVAASRGSFPGRFDELMQRMNYGETNGIIIGPEFSRLFAEIILQSIDRTVEKTLAQAPYMLRHKVDYQIFRYVDDYFIFFNDEQQKQQILNVLQHSLREYRLYRNPAKDIIYEKPIITEISRAKREVANLFEGKLRYHLDEVQATDTEDAYYKGSIHVDSKALIIEFKTIIKVCSVDYKDILNYSLAVVENKCDGILRDFNATSLAHRSLRNLVNAVLAILEFVFFIYSVSPRVNTTVKLCRILRMITQFFQPSIVPYEHKHLIYKYIFDDITLVLRKNKSDKFTQVETLYLLITLSELGKDYWLEEDVLAGYFGVPINKTSGEYHECPGLNHFSLTVVLFYMKSKVRYNRLRHCIEKSILAKFRERSATYNKDAELTLLFFDIVACPYVSNATKESLLSTFGVTDPVLKTEIIAFRSDNRLPQQWFTTWHKFDFGKELDRKKGFEVY